jgi:hypothetical protein
MAAKEVIHFVFCPQLDGGLPFQPYLCLVARPFHTLPRPIPEDADNVRAAGTTWPRNWSGCRMKLRLFQQILGLNQSFDQLIADLEGLESVPFFQRDLIRHAHSDVEIARVYANREFFDNFEKIVEDDAKWAYRFQRNFNEKRNDRDDIYLEVKTSEERRKRKGLPPRVVILPNWDMSDEDRHDEERASRRAKSALKRRRKTRTTRSPEITPKKEGHL